MLEAIASIPTTILLIILLSQYLLLLLPARKFATDYSPPVSIVIPAHNEESSIEGTLRAVSATDYADKEIIVVENGSTDNTLSKLKEISKKYKLKVFRTGDASKPKAANLGVSKAKNDIVIVMDADSHPSKDSIRKLVAPFSDRKIGAVSGVMRVKNKSKPLAWFQSVEYANFSCINKILSKINGIIFTFGLISAYRKDVLEKIGMFPESSKTEDLDVAIMIHESGYRIEHADAVTRTDVPETFRHLIRQRMRWGRGILMTLKRLRRMFFNRGHFSIGFYSMPILTYWFPHAVLMVPILLYWMISGYFKWFVATSSAFSVPALKYFLNWLSLAGISNLAYQTYAGSIALTYFLGVTIAVALLSHLFFAIAVLTFDRRLGPKELIAIVFFFPYILFTSAVQIAALLANMFSKREIKW